LESNDEISLNITTKKKQNNFSIYGKYDYRFTGNGAAKYLLNVRIEKIGGTTSGQPLFDSVYNYNDPCSSTVANALQMIEGYKDKISNIAYNVLKADVFYNQSTLKYYSLLNFYNKVKSLNSKDDLEKFLFAYNNSPINKYERNGIPEEYLLKSKNFLPYTYRRFLAKRKINSLSESQDSIYYSIKNEFQGELKDKLLVCYLYTIKSNDFGKLYSDAIATVKTPFYLGKLKENRSKLAGNQALDFSLPDTTGNMIRLSDFAGKVVLVDFWFTGCGSCYFLYRDVLSKAEEYFRNDKNVIFLSISIDRNREKWLNSVNAGKYTSPFAVNLFTQGMGPNISFIKHYSIYEFPTVMLIDQKGRIVRYNSQDLFKEVSVIDAINSILKMELSKN
jgi:thiol-disulfide isomerase/thioredoxin